MVQQFGPIKQICVKSIYCICETSTHLQTAKFIEFFGKILCVWDVCQLFVPKGSTLTIKIEKFVGNFRLA